MAVTLAMLATGVLKPRSLMAANSGSSSRCIDRLHSLTLLRRIVRALFLALRASRSVLFSLPTLVVASSSETASNSMMGRSPSSSPSSAISTWWETSSSELESTSSIDSSATVANGLPSWKGKGSRWATSRSSALSRSEGSMPLQCTKRPSGMEVIIRSLASKLPKAPRHAVASGPPNWSRESRSFSDAERDPETSAS
jgi:hypothetical protein